MRNVLAIGLLSLGSSQAIAASNPHQDALVASYFAIWDQDVNVTFDKVAALYAPNIVYYGHPMTRQELLDDKLNFIRRWPSRRYAVEPGSASKSCNAAIDRCVITATLVWRTSGGGVTRSGRSRVKLSLTRVDGGMKIERESGTTFR